MTALDPRVLATRRRVGFQNGNLLRDRRRQGDEDTKIYRIGHRIRHKSLSNVLYHREQFHLVRRTVTVTSSPYFGVRRVTVAQRVARQNDRHKTRCRSEKVIKSLASRILDPLTQRTLPATGAFAKTTVTFC